ncbi:DMT family transporter [Alkalicoccus daliensis]|uniref:Threonine/homoserine efflux transporter RhtA n=1 Tax=Alkalicoccus daliensis TaxID=745820 RepID=A0A1H0GVF4_9BACI|nr:DMT family transporter [Alkalicoccus daliensis]SDO11026.1 Threonine/homoserine efflux transporter RhtA [Alkalicoccus daliensis]
MSNKMAYLIVMAGAALWGTIGIFVNQLNAAGFTPWEVVGIRLSFSAGLLLLFLLLFKRHLLYVKLRDLPFFIGTGIISIAFFNYFFFTVIETATLSLAIVLLYTGPVFVALISRFTFGEPFTGRKIAALVLMMLGCVFAVELLPAGSLSVSGTTILFGVLSGFFYALYSIFGKYVSGRYHAMTITTYSMVFGSLFLLPTSRLWEKSHLLTSTPVLLSSFGIAAVATVFAYIFYTAGLRYIESSRAAILSTVEPVVGIIIGLLVFQEVVTFWQGIGMALVLASVLLTVQKQKRTHPMALKWKGKKTG